MNPEPASVVLKRNTRLGMPEAGVLLTDPARGSYCTMRRADRLAAIWSKIAPSEFESGAK
jgi:hypothetical protein